MSYTFRFKNKKRRGKIFSRSAKFDLEELSSIRKRDSSEFKKYVLERIRAP